MSEQSQLEQAKAIHADALVLDAHADVASASTSPRFLTEHGRSRVDPELMREGGVDAVILSLAAGPGPRTPTGYAAARKSVGEKLTLVRDLIDESAGAIVHAKTVNELLAAKSENKIAIMLGFQNALILGEDPSGIEEFYRFGARVFALTHMGHNDFADSSRPLKVTAMGWDEPVEEHGGLSDLGKEAIRLIDKIGGVVDISQLSTAAALQAIKLSKRPVIASHSNVRGVSNATRNVTDKVLDEIAHNGGVVHVAAFLAFLVPSEDKERHKKITEARGRAGLDREFVLYPMEGYWNIKDEDVSAQFVADMGDILSDFYAVYFVRCGYAAGSQSYGQQAQQQSGTS